MDKKPVWGQLVPLRKHSKANTPARAKGKAMRAALAYVRSNPGCPLVDCARSIYGKNFPGGWRRERPDFRPIYRLLERGDLIRGPSPILSTCGLYLKTDDGMMLAEEARRAAFRDRYPADWKVHQSELKAARALGAFLVWICDPLPWPNEISVVAGERFAFGLGDRM